VQDGRGHGRIERRVVKAVTAASLPAAQARPARLAQWRRGHWKIENPLHWVRDVTFGEDAYTPGALPGPWRRREGPRVSQAGWVLPSCRPASVSRVAAGGGVRRGFGPLAR
jgi:hypothetical protein